MSSPPALTKSSLASFRIKLLATMMLAVSVSTLLGIYFAQRQLSADVKQDRRREFQAEIASLHSVRELRHAALAERCRALVQEPRIHAALEDNALDLLYPNAKDELQDLMDREEADSDQPAKIRPLRATFYRFLDRKGVVIPPPNAKEVGELRAEEESQFTLNAVPEEQQIGYLLRRVDGANETIDEVIAMPIISTETYEPIAALVAGFKPVELGGPRTTEGIQTGIWLKGHLQLPSLGEASQSGPPPGNESGNGLTGAGRAKLHSRGERRAASAFLPAAQSELAFPPRL